MWYLVYVLSLSMEFEWLNLLAEMSTKLQFEIYYGEDSVVEGPYRVQLNGFSRTWKGIDKPWDKSFGSVHSWLERGFKIDTETHALTV